jgi:hypothetical protein
MFSDSKPVFQRLGYATLILASFLLLLFLANLRSRFYYNGPDYGFLFWLFAWALAVGVGLLLLRKWAVVLLFLPDIAFAAIVCAGLLKPSEIAPWAIVANVLFVAVTVAVPMGLLRYWKTLHW